MTENYNDEDVFDCPEEGVQNRDSEIIPKKEGIFEKMGIGRKEKSTPPPPPMGIPAAKLPVKSRIKRTAKKILICLIVGIVIFLIAAVCYFRLPAHDYFKNSEKAFKIPELNKGFVCQGICYDASSSDFFVTGYMEDSSASPIYIIDKDSKKVEKKILMSSPDNQPLASNAGGIGYHNDKIYVAGSEDMVVYVFDMVDLREAENKSFVSYKNIINLKTENDYLKADFITFRDDLMYVGEYYKKNKFLTSESHEIKESDQTYNALVVAFSLNGNNAYPVTAYSVIDKAQGIAFDTDNAYLSCSYGLSFSKIHVYEKSKMQKKENIELLGFDVPLYILDNNCEVDVWTLPPMSQEIELVNGKLYTLNKAASKKYKFGKLYGAGKCLYTDTEAMLSRKTEDQK